MTRRTTGRSTAPAQKALFGRQQPIPQQGRPARPEINDPELVASVVRAAMNRGYVLVGPAQRVYLRDPGATGKGARVEPVPAYEQDAVHQLLEAGQLTAGGTHIVRASGREGPASSVLVPKATRSMVTRWANFVPLHGRTRADGGPGDGQSISAPALWCPECGERAVPHPPTRWAEANGPRPQNSHRDGEPLCPVTTRRATARRSPPPGALHKRRARQSTGGRPDEHRPGPVTRTHPQRPPPVDHGRPVMPAVSYRRERMSKFKQRTIAADSCRYIEIHGSDAELDCPRCAHTLRTRHTGDHARQEGGPLWSALLDHLFADCPAVEYAR